MKGDISTYVTFLFGGGMTSVLTSRGSISLSFCSYFMWIRWIEAGQHICNLILLSWYMLEFYVEVTEPVGLANKPIISNHVPCVKKSFKIVEVTSKNERSILQSHLNNFEWFLDTRHMEKVRNYRLICWSYWISHSDKKFKHVPGQKNQIVDMLSRLFLLDPHTVATKGQGDVAPPWGYHWCHTSTE